MVSHWIVNFLRVGTVFYSFLYISTLGPQYIYIVYWMKQTVFYLTLFYSWTSYPQTLIWTLLHPKTISSFQFLRGTRSTFSLTFPTTFSTLVWGPGTLIYLVPKHIFGHNPLCFCTCQSLSCDLSNSFRLKTLF